MKLKTLAAATAVALAGLSGQAMAVLCTGAGAPAAYCTGNDVANGPFVATTPATVDVFLSGASAPQNILGALAGSLFGANTVGFNSFWVLYDNGVSGTAGASYRTYQGRLTAAVTDTVTGTTLPAGRMVRLQHRAKGGSVWGVNPVAGSDAVPGPDAIANMPATSTNCVSVVSTSRSHECGEAGNDLTLTGRIPDFGVSDMEPRMFKEPLNVEFGQPALANPGVLNTKAVSGLLFGIAATAAVPTTIEFNKAMVSALLTGDIGDWNTLSSTIPAGTPVVICRRVQGSGSQATFNAYFNNFPCGTASIYGTGSTTPLRMADSGGFDDFSVPGTISVDPTAGGTVIIENPSSGNVRTCLEKAQQGAAHATGSIHSFVSDDGRPVTVNFGAGGYRAIGVLSLDSTPVAGVWDFRTLSGVVGDKANMRSGRYDFWAEQSMQYLPSHFATLTPEQRAFINIFRTRAGDPLILNAISSVPLRNATAALPIDYVPNETTTAGLNTTRVTSFGNSCSPKRRVY